MSVDKIVQHMMEGVVFHSQLSQYYRFLNLCCYADFHAHQAEEEFATLVKFQKWYIDSHQMLIAQTQPTIEDIIPQDWYAHIKSDVDKNTLRESVKNGHIRWVNWEAETKKLYEDQIKASDIEIDKIQLRKLLKEVQKEWVKAKQKYISLKNCDYDISEIIAENRQDSE